MKLALLIGSTTVAATLLATYGPGERVLAALGLGPAPQHYLGYVEGESTLVAPPISGRLVARLVERGGKVDKGDRLYIIDTTQAEAEVERATAMLAEFQARHDNMMTGKRTDEMDVIRAQHSEVDASLALAEADLRREADLVKRGVTSRQAYDQAVAQVVER